MMKRHAVTLLCAMLTLLLLPGAALGARRGAAPQPVGREYPLNDRGEAIVNDVVFHGETPDDNARVFYEIFVGSFSDSNGDGMGDLRGILDRLDYLNDGDPTSGVSLGVDGLWLTPVFRSPSYHKYDIADYYAIDPVFGDMDDLRALIEGCHARGMKLILDLPINHTSREHAWFEAFRQSHLRGDAEDPAYDAYTWMPAGSIFPAGRRFVPVASTDIWVESNFSDDMPELNYDCPAVRESMLDVARFYLELGVDGFRFDAAKYIYLGNHAESAAFWQWYVGQLTAIRPDLYTVAEVWDTDNVTLRYASAVNCFNFTGAQTDGRIASAAKKGNVNRYTAYLEDYICRLRAENPAAMPVMFVANHDMDRAAGYLTAANGSLYMAANLYLLGPGSPFIYYGEEIGLRGSRGAAMTDANRRLAMRWGDGDTVSDPEGATYAAANQTPDTVQSLLSGGGSIYNYYKRVLLLRRANPEIARGEYRALSLEDTKAGGFTSTLDGVTVAVLHNTTTDPVTLDLSAIDGLQGMTELQFIGLGEAALDGSLLTIGAQTSVILR